MKKIRGLIWGALSAMTLLVLTAADAQAVTLNGGWAPYTRCPVNDPAMLATDGVNSQAFCVFTDSPGGTLKIGTMGVIQLGPVQIGNAPETAGHSNVQFGAVFPANVFAGVPGISPQGGVVLADPVIVPGGVLGLICPASDPLVSWVCGLITNNDLNRVTATLESAAPAPSNFDQFAAAETAAPIITLPVKIHLHNTFLGNNCYIGTDQNPVLLVPQNTSTNENITTQNYDLNGNTNPNGLLSQFLITQATFVDNTFAVPGASGCGFLPILQPVLNAVLNVKVGLPAKSGVNHLTLNNVTTGFMQPATVDNPINGNAFAQAWASAVTGQ